MTTKKLVGMVAGALVAVAGIALAADHVHGHGAKHHDHGANSKGLAGLELNAGKKWETDASLREGMVAIRNALQAAVAPIHAETYTPAQYRALAAAIEKEVGTILTKCRLPPAADAQIHFVISEAVAAAEVMKADGKRIAGAAKLVDALAAYEKFFEHPGWKPLEH